MHSEVLRPGIALGQYPERDHACRNAFDTALHNALGALRRCSLNHTRRADRFVDGVNDASAGLQQLSEGRFRQRVDEMRQQLARAGLDEKRAVACFALVREAARRTLGQRHYDTQILGGWVMLNVMLAEMETGEGKTLTATLPAGAAALAGIPVHVITANDYLAGRDAELMAPVYKLLGLRVGAVAEQAREPDARRQAYACDITYGTQKQVAFDYLRDRVAMGSRRGALDLQLRQMTGRGGNAAPLLLRGLCFAIVDEADSVLIDDAGTPLILSRELNNPLAEETCVKALDMAGRLEEGRDYRLHSQYHDIELTSTGRSRLLEQAAGLPAPWSRQRDAETLVHQALRALHCYRKDRDYLVHDAKVQIVDANTGRLMPDHSWEQGLHQMIEASEGCRITGERQTLARISYQRFFRRYLHLSGMTGTAREVAGELWSVYGLQVVKVPTFRPLRRRAGTDRAYATADQKWQAIVTRVREIRRSGRPVLVGTSSVEDSEHLSRVLNQAAIPHTVLNARQDGQEAGIIARAGQAGTITVATNMAGRGTDIKLQQGIAERGGLHIIAADRNEAGRIDRQLFGRCGRQGDPGSFEAMLSLQDAILKKHFPQTLTRLTSVLARFGIPVPGLLMMRIAQRLAERHHARLRRNLLRVDEQLKETMAFSGPIE
jgi:preprotein translocase subunit SecA